MKKRFRITAVILSLAICLGSMSVLSGCGGSTGGYKKNKALNTAEEITLRIACSKETWPEMDNVIAKFEEIYPNCTIVCEYIEEYSKNWRSGLPRRTGRSIFSER